MSLKSKLPSPVLDLSKNATVQITTLENKVETLTPEKMMIEVCFKTHNDKAGALWPGLESA